MPFPKKKQLFVQSHSFTENHILFFKENWNLEVKAVPETILIYTKQ